MRAIEFTLKGRRDFEKLPKEIQKFIYKKLLFYSSQADPLTFSKPLINLPPSTHRFRIRKYRAYFFISDKTIFIERIKIRGQAYRV